VPKVNAREARGERTSLSERTVIRPTNRFVRMYKQLEQSFEMMSIRCVHTNAIHSVVIDGVFRFLPTIDVHQSKLTIGSNGCHASSVDGMHSICSQLGVCDVFYLVCCWCVRANLPDGETRTLPLVERFALSPSTGVIACHHYECMTCDRHDYYAYKSHWVKMIAHEIRRGLVASLKTRFAGSCDCVGLATTRTEFHYHDVHPRMLGCRT
jgi:hypothetical protein